MLQSYTCMQYTVIQKIIHTEKWSKHSEMGPVRQNNFQRTVRSVHTYVCALHCAQLLHTILHRTDLIIIPLTLQTITIAPMISIWGKWGTLSFKNCLYVYEYHCAQPLYITQHRTVQMCFPHYPPDNHYCSDAVYWREGEKEHTS